MVKYTGLRENSTSILQRDKTLKSLWKYERMYLWDYARRKRVVIDTMFTILLILTWGLKYPQIRREAEKGGVEISCRACLLFPCYFGYKKKASISSIFLHHLIIALRKKMHTKSALYSLYFRKWKFLMFFKRKLFLIFK